MKKLYVYADFDWLKEVELIGELGYESLRFVQHEHTLMGASP